MCRADIAFAAAAHCAQLQPHRRLRGVRSGRGRRPHPRWQLARGGSGRGSHRHPRARSRAWLRCSSAGAARPPCAPAGRANAAAGRGVSCGRGCAGGGGKGSGGGRSDGGRSDGRGRAGPWRSLRRQLETEQHSECNVAARTFRSVRAIAEAWRRYRRGLRRLHAAD